MKANNNILQIIFFVSLILIVGLVGAGYGETQFQRLPTDSGYEIYQWKDTCNVYVLKDGDAALLIDFGDGSVLDHLDQIGVKRVEWVLFTHHHREQCQGYSKQLNPEMKVAVPQAERALFESPGQFLKAKPTLHDAYTVCGVSYVRPSAEPIEVDRGLKDTEIFQWRGYELRCMDTRGNSPGSMSYLLKAKNRWLVFSGDVMLNGGKMHNWFDSEWDYGYGEGLYDLITSASMLKGFDPLYLLPSHGPVIHEPSEQLTQYGNKLRRLAKLYVRGYDIGNKRAKTFVPVERDIVSKPTVIPNIWQITEHLYKFRHRDYSPNFVILIADSGRALVFDAGLNKGDRLEKALEQMQKHLGLKKIDAVLVSHMHGDHFWDVPYLQEKWGPKIWTLDRVAPPCENPLRYNYAAMINTYSSYTGGIESIQFDRLFKSGEEFEWEGYKFTVDWMPGQTEFACSVQGMIDGKLIAFTGDNIMGDSQNPDHTGHEAVVARNSAIFEEGYIYAGKYLKDLQPDIIIGGHSWVIDQPTKIIDRYLKWAIEIRDQYQDLSFHEDYRYMFDPYWVRAEPYRLFTKPGQTVSAVLHVRNFLSRSQSCRIVVQTPEGISITPTEINQQLEPESVTQIPLSIKTSKNAKPGRWIIPFDITLEKQRYGQLFDMLLILE